MDKITSDRWAITKVSKFDDDQQYPKYLPGRLTYSNGFHCIFRTYNGDLGILTRDLYNIDGGLLSKNLTDTLTAIDKIKQGDPKHLHVPSIQRHLENALEILATHIPKASKHIAHVLQLLDENESSDVWQIEVYRNFYLYIGHAIAHIFGIHD